VALKELKAEVEHRKSSKVDRETAELERTKVEKSVFFLSIVDFLP
jgi:hypothetical protein